MLFQDYSEDLIILALSDNDDKYMLMRWGKKKCKERFFYPKRIQCRPMEKKGHNVVYLTPFDIIILLGIVQ